MRSQDWIQAIGGQSCYANQHHDSSPVSGKELHPGLLRKEQYFFCLFGGGVQESKRHGLVLGQGGVGSFSCCKTLWYFGVLNLRGAWTLHQRQESETVHCTGCQQGKCINSAGHMFGYCGALGLIVPADSSRKVHGLTLFGLRSPPIPVSTWRIRKGPGRRVK